MKTEQEKIYEKLDQMLTNPKSKNFLNHIVRAYMPITNVDKVYETPAGEFKCFLTKSPLVSVDFIMKGTQTEQFKNDFMTHLKSMVNEETIAKSPIGNLLDGKVLGFTGKDTTTYISSPALQVFYDWVATKISQGDKHINWLMANIRNANKPVHKPVVNKAIVDKSVTSTYTLGDSSDVLSRLKNQLENNG